VKRLLIVALTGVLGLSIGFAGLNLFAWLMKPSAVEPQGIASDWASSARTVAEEAAEAEVIVRAEVLRQGPVREVVDAFPTAAQKSNFAESVIPYTDSHLRVLEVYKGSVGEEIVVSQMGGKVAATDRHPRMDLQDTQDPLFKPGGQHVLFLIDLSDGHQRYSTVNPLGRYDIQDGRLVTHSEMLVDFKPLATLEALEADIQRAVSSR